MKHIKLQNTSTSWKRNPYWIRIQIRILQILNNKWSVWNRRKRKDLKLVGCVAEIIAAVRKIQSQWEIIEKQPQEVFNQKNFFKPAFQEQLENQDIFAIIVMQPVLMVMLTLLVFAGVTAIHVWMLSKLTQFRNRGCRLLSRQSSHAFA